MSFNIGLSGLTAAQDEINITGNNIANASTTGFKSSRAEFADVYAASVLGGGSNQAGSGVALQAISQNFTQGNISFTDSALDLAINGKGFFILSGVRGLAYTRAGAFGTDSEGNITSNAGERLQGFPPTVEGTASGGGALTDLVVTTGEISPRATTKVTSTINLDAGATPSSIVGTNVVTNSGTSGTPQLGSRIARIAEITGTISTTGTDFSGTTAATTTGNFNISTGLQLSAGGPHSFGVSVNGGAFVNIVLGTTDQAAGSDVVTLVQGLLNAQLSAPNNVNVTLANNRLVLTTAATGNSSNITIGGAVLGLATNLVTANSNVSGKTAPPTGFSLSYNGLVRDIVVDQDFTNTGTAALALGGGTGSGNEALEDYIQAQIDTSSALLGNVTVAIDNLGNIAFRSTQAADHNLTVNPIVTTAGSVNFNQIVTFNATRRDGQMNLNPVTNIDFSGANNTSFTIVVDGVSQQITLNQDFRVSGAPSSTLGSDPESGLEALEDAIQSQINSNVNLPGSVKVSIGAAGDISFEITDPNAKSLKVNSDSVSAISTGTLDVGNGFDFATTNYTFTVAYSVDGSPTVTSNAITLNTNHASSAALIVDLQNKLNTDSNLAFTPGNEAIIVTIDPVSGLVSLSTRGTGPTAEITVNVIVPGTSTVLSDDAGLMTGSGPPVDFSTYVTFTGSELDNTGANAVTNGYSEEVISVVDKNNITHLITVPAGSNANAVAQLFSNITGITTTAKTVAYITATNRGDTEDTGFVVGSNVDSNLPLGFSINGQNFLTTQVTQGDRLAELEALINASSGNLSAKVITDADGDSILEITENNGLDLTFTGGTNGQGSITVIGSTVDPITGATQVSTLSIDERQIANLTNLKNDAITIGGIIEFTLDEGVTFADAGTSAGGTIINPVATSIFGNINDSSVLAGSVFELNTFDPDNPNTYFRSTALAVFDSLGNQHTLTQYFVKERTDSAGNAVTGSIWSVYFQIDGEDIGYDPNSTDPTIPVLARAEVRFNQNGLYDVQNNIAIAITNWTPRDNNGALSNQAAGPIRGDTDSFIEITNSNFSIDFSNLTQFGGDFAVNSNVQDGFAKGQLTGLDIDSKGVLFARFSNGQSEVLGEVALADFPNPSGLTNLGGTRFAETSDSGAGTPSGAGTAGLGVIQSGALEDSNVDLSDQLVQLIISQRNFQAAAQIIEATDATTQTIINL